MSRGVLPRGLSNTCPQACTLRGAVAWHGLVSNEPKQDLISTKVAAGQSNSTVRCRTTGAADGLAGPDPTCPPVAPKPPDGEPSIFLFRFYRIARLHHRPNGSASSWGSCRCQPAMDGALRRDSVGFDEGCAHMAGERKPYPLPFVQGLQATAKGAARDHPGFRRIAVQICNARLRKQLGHSRCHVELQIRKV